jgi:pimeloyl-ACP methyl ester carboxylesterase
VAGLRSPALVLHARGDGSIPLAMAEELARAIPGARLEVVENSGHTMQVERPALFNDLVLGWVKEREGEVT